MNCVAASALMAGDPSSHDWKQGLLAPVAKRSIQGVTDDSDVSRDVSKIWIYAVKARAVWLATRRKIKADPA